MLSIVSVEIRSKPVARRLMNSMWLAYRFWQLGTAFNFKNSAVCDALQLIWPICRKPKWKEGRNFFNYPGKATAQSPVLLSKS